MDDEDIYDEYDDFESLDPVCRRGDLLTRLASAVDVTSNKEAKAHLLTAMGRVVETLHAKPAPVTELSFNGKPKQ